MGVLSSMTGFGAAQRDALGIAVRVEVRAVNHRGLQVKARLPAELSALESDVEARVRARIARGAVSLNVSLERGGGLAGTGFDLEAARRWTETLESAARTLGLAAQPTLEVLVGLPGVVVTGAAASQELAPEVAELVFACVDDALASLAEMREREGGALARDLLENALEVERLVELVRARMPEVVRGHHEALRARLAELIGANVPAADLAREAALIADRMDVGEELARLGSHLHQLRGLVSAGGQVGRKLDFLAQEFFREANTTGAKCNDAAVAHLVVDLKTHIERMREQVQNVE
ncbi:MAG: YicC/YloC family endoribonuclease [Planctomycetota bacterium]